MSSARSVKGKGSAKDTTAATTASASADRSEGLRRKDDAESDSDELTPVPSLSPKDSSSPPRRSSASGGSKKRAAAAAVVESSDEEDDVPVRALAKRAQSTLASSGAAKSAVSQPKKRRVAISSDEEELDVGDEDEIEVAPEPAPSVPAKKAAAKAGKPKGAAAAKSKAPASPAAAAQEAPPSRGLERQPTIAALGETTDAETTDGRSPVKRARTGAGPKGKGKKASAEKDGKGKKAASKGKGKGKTGASEPEDEAAHEDEETEGDENAVRRRIARRADLPHLTDAPMTALLAPHQAPPPAPAAPSPAKPASPVKRVAAASANSSAKFARHGTPSGLGGGPGAASTPSYKIPRHLPPFKDGRGRAGSVGGIAIPPALGLAARPLSRLGSETPGSASTWVARSPSVVRLIADSLPLPSSAGGVKLNAIVSRTAHLVVGTPAGPDQPAGGHATPSPSAAVKSRASGLSRRGIARTPLLTAIAPAPKRLGAAPVEKKRPKKSDLNPDDFSDGEWEEMEKERKRKERDWDAWD